MLFQFEIILVSEANLTLVSRFSQGGPHNHTIGGLAVCLKYAQTPEFKAYQKQVLFYMLFREQWTIERTLYSLTKKKDNLV